MSTLLIGRSNYETSCQNCHGAEGEGPIREIILDACRLTDCTDLDAMANYISLAMPTGNAPSCNLIGDNSCALTTAAYILNGFSTEVTDASGPFAPVPTEPVPTDPGPTSPVPTDPEPTDPVPTDPGPTSPVPTDPGPTEPVPTDPGPTSPVPTEPEPIEPSVRTPQARLTNDEYVNSVRTLLELPVNSPEVEGAKSALVSEAVVDGLTNDSSTQGVTQLTLSGYSAIAAAASNDFLNGVTTRGDLAELMECTVIIPGYNPNNQLGVCIQQFSRNLIEKAYRRPSNDVDDANIQELLSNLRGLNDLLDVAELFSAEYFVLYVQRIIQYVMLSPEFLLIVEKGVEGSGDALSKQLTDHEIATRLALFLAGTLPDDSLLAAADAGLLGSAAARLQHADRLMNSEIGVEQFTTLVNNWLDIDDTAAEEVDLIAVEAFISNWFANEGAFSDLYNAPVTVQRVDGTQSTEPLGVLGLRAFVASHTSFPTPGFINRGAFVVERLLCQKLPEDLPDEALTAGDLTPQEAFEVHAQQPCASCHLVFDNYGAAFQQFDDETSLFSPAAQTYGSSFDLFDIGDVTTTVSGLGDLGFAMGASQQASSCMAELWYRHSTRRNIDTQGKDENKIQALIDAWAESGDTSMKSLLRAIVASDSFITLYL